MENCTILFLRKKICKGIPCTNRSTLFHGNNDPDRDCVRRFQLKQKPLTDTPYVYDKNYIPHTGFFDCHNLAN